MVDSGLRTEPNRRAETPKPPGAQPAGRGLLLRLLVRGSGGGGGVTADGLREVRAEVPSAPRMGNRFPAPWWSFDRAREKGRVKRFERKRAPLLEVSMDFSPLLGVGPFFFFQQAVFFLHTTCVVFFSSSSGLVALL